MILEPDIELCYGDQIYQIQVKLCGKGPHSPLQLIKVVQCNSTEPTGLYI